MERLRLLEPQARARLGPFPVKYNVFDEVSFTNLHSPPVSGNSLSTQKRKRCCDACIATNIQNQEE